MTQQTALPEKLRGTFEQFGVIKKIAVPKLDLLDKAINDRKGKWELSKNADGLAVAKVTMQGQTFDGAADESNLALSIAFAQALIATQPRQGDMFDPPAVPSHTPPKPTPPTRRNGAPTNVDFDQAEALQRAGALT